jgi:predicted nucleic acid-binding protein
LLTSKARAATPAIVLDTNVVLDWLLFRDPSSKPLAAAIEQRRVRWVASPSMRVELTEVLQRGLAAARNTDPAAVLARWDCFAVLHDEPARLAGKPALQCADPDDQVFLDLAWATSARWLVSRDRALLRLARSAAVFDLAVTAPEHWSAPE